MADYWIAKGRDRQARCLQELQERGLGRTSSRYQVPVITLAHDTSHEAVCLVFEKVNTGGKALDAFELLTAMYAARRAQTPGRLAWR